MVVGALLLLVTALPAWKEAELDVLFVVPAGSALALLATVLLERSKTRHYGPVMSLVSALAAGATYAMTPHPLIVAAIAMSFGTFAWLAWVYRDWSEDEGHRALVFQGLAWTGLLVTMTGSFQLFHASGLLDAEYVKRRVILTLLWLGAGLWFFVRGSHRDDGSMRNGGLVLTVAGLGKLLLYDTTHLDGALRIAVMGVAGLLTLAAGQLLARSHHESGPRGVAATVPPREATPDLLGTPPG